MLEVYARMFSSYPISTLMQVAFENINIFH